MRDDLERGDETRADLTEIGSASELTQGSFMPLAYEAINIKDRFEE